MHQPTPESFCRHETVPAARSLDPLDPLEERVVRLARRDADRGAIEPRRSLLARFMAVLTGMEGPRPLADDRLEALRRFACFARRGDRRAGGVATDLLGLGFSPEALARAAAIARA